METTEGLLDKRRRFKQQLDQLQEVVFGGLSSYRVWTVLKLHDPALVSWSLERQNQILGRYRGFFTPVGASLQRMALLEIAKIFDHDHRSVSIRVLLGQARLDPELVPQAQPGDLDEIGQRLRHSQSALTVINEMRNRRLAHTDAQEISTDPLPSQKVDALLDDIKFAFNRLSVAHDGSFYDWDHSLSESERHTHEILRLLDEEMARRQLEGDEKLVSIVFEHLRGIEQRIGQPTSHDEFEYQLGSFHLDADLENRVRQKMGREGPK